MPGKAAIRYEALALLLCWSASAAQELGPIPTPFDAEYRLSRDGLSFGRTTLSLSRKGRQYLYRAHTATTGMAALLFDTEITETSRGVIEQGRITPHTYTYHHRSGEKSRSVEISFDWQRGQATNHSDHSRWVMPIEVGTLDKFGVQLAVMLDMSRGENQLTYQVADGGKPKRYEFSYTGTERLETPLGSMETLQMRRSKQGRESDARFWFAPALGHLPVRIVRGNDSGVYLMELQRLEPYSGAAAGIPETTRQH